MFDLEAMQKAVVELEDRQKQRFIESGESFIAFFSSEEELFQDHTITLMRHLVMFAELNQPKE